MPSVPSSSRTLWAPLLDGSQARIAQETILAIADAVRGEFDNILQKCKEPPEAYAPAFELGEGAAGMAGFFFLLHPPGPPPPAPRKAFSLSAAGPRIPRGAALTPPPFNPLSPRGRGPPPPA